MELLTRQRHSSSYIIFIIFLNISSLVLCGSLASLGTKLRDLTPHTERYQIIMAGDLASIVPTQNGEMKIVCQQEGALSLSSNQEISRYDTLSPSARHLALRVAPVLSEL